MAHRGHDRLDGGHRPVRDCGRRDGKAVPDLLQLAKHFRHKLDVRFDAQEAVIPFAFGHAELRAVDRGLGITAFAQRPDDLRRVQHVIASHLERFGRRDELRVDWTPGRS